MKSHVKFNQSSYLKSQKHSKHRTLARTTTFRANTDYVTKLCNKILRRFFKMKPEDGQR